MQSWKLVIVTDSNIHAKLTHKIDVLTWNEIKSYVKLYLAIIDAKVFLINYGTFLSVCVFV